MDDEEKRRKLALANAGHGPEDDNEVRARHEIMTHTWQRMPGIGGWICTTNHKDIAIRYIITAFVFFGLAGILALLMRIQLAFPEMGFIDPDRYNQIFTVHGSTMMFLFAVPVMEAMALYLIPLMVGTGNVAFPRLNALGYYVYLIGGVLLFVGLFLNIGADTGWFSYVPLAGPEFSPGKRVDFWAQMVTFTEIAAMIAAVEIIVTVFKQRAPGMSLNRMPIYVWTMLVTAFMIVFAMPAVMLVSSMLAMDRLTNVATHFFNQAEGGDALLYQHLFWFFGHPEVYIIFLPATGFVSAIVGAFSRRKLFGYLGLVLSMVAIGFISFGLWVHHMFTTPIAELGRSFFSGSSMMIAIPNGVQVFIWLANLWTGKPRFHTPLLFACGFIALFVLGGLTGVMMASVPLDTQVHDSYFVVAHFHYVLVGGSVFPLFGAVYYWFPKITGRMMSERLGRWNFWLFFTGFNLTFFPMHILGLQGMPRRVYTYLPETGWGPLNLLATIGGVVLAVSVVLFVINVIRSLRSGSPAGENPWDSDSLEWAMPSPPPAYNFMYLPTVQSRHPLWEVPTHRRVITGLKAEQREVLTTSLMDASPQHVFPVAMDSIWPPLLALVSAVAFVGVIFHPWAIPVGAALTFVVLTLWFWRENEPAFLSEQRHASE